jgi:hypothetical protein
MDKGLFPYEIDHFNDAVNFRTAFKYLFEALARLGKYTTKLLRQCVDEDEMHQHNGDDDAKKTFMSSEKIRKEVTSLFEAWMGYFVIHAEAMKETQTFVTDGKKVNTTVGYHLFTELTRLNYLLQRPRLMLDLSEEDMQSLDNTHHPSWINIVNSFDISNQYEEKEDKDMDVETQLQELKVLWKRPVLFYTQSQAQMVIMFLTQQLNEVRADSVLEFKSMYEWLWIRIAQLQMEVLPPQVIDVEDMRICVLKEEKMYACNRDFGIFVSFYMGEICRRLFYYEMLSKRALKLPGVHGIIDTQRCRSWIEHIVKFFAEEAFTDLYVDSCNESYSFPGDDQWFKFRWPRKIHSRAACLADLRPHLYRRFFSESRATRSSVLNSINSSHVSRLFMLKAISQYIQIKMGGATEVRWYQGVVIHSNDIYMSTYNLQNNMAPFLLQVLSTYWAYDEGTVWKCDEFYETLCVWFRLLRNRYAGQLFGYDLSKFVYDAIGSLENDEEEEEVGGSNGVGALPVGFLL